jgi:Na+-transporting methylmalonyl-CoA/oxaloacetate decarboxylase beta subunit
VDNRRLIIWLAVKKDYETGASSADGFGAISSTCRFPANGNNGLCNAFSKGIEASEAFRSAFFASAPYDFGRCFLIRACCFWRRAQFGIFFTVVMAILWVYAKDAFSIGVLRAADVVLHPLSQQLNSKYGFHAVAPIRIWLWCADSAAHPHGQHEMKSA